MTVHHLRLSRRGLMGGAGALVIGMVLPFGRFARAQAPAKAPPPVDPNAFIRIAPDSSVLVLIKHIDFGQGTYTGLATIVAEELDADWAQVHAEAAPANLKLYANTLMGIQGTGGSSAIAESYQQMRRAGAAARAMLVLAAAQTWKVPPASISVENGVIRHVASGRQGHFGDFAGAAARLPVPANPVLKNPARFTLIGQDRSGRKLDSLAKTTGQAKFGIDQTAPNMLTVAVLHPPRFGARLAHVDSTAAMAVKGVVAVHSLTSGVAVYAHGTWPALKGRKALAATWDESGAETRGSEEMIAQYRDRARAPGQVVKAKGDVDAAFAANGAEVVEVDYVFPYLAHAPMEPLGGFLDWDGKRAVARFGSQLQTGDHMAIAKVLGLPPEQVDLETTFAGGSFGRRATPTSHLAVELAEAAKAIGPGTPIRLTWTREDDIQGGYYRPLMVHHMKGAVKGGRIVAWSDNVVGQSFAYGTPFEKMMTAPGYDGSMVEGADEIPYAVPAFRCTVAHDPTPVTTLWWRSVGHTHTGYAVETFVDHLLEKAGQDPVAGRLAMMGDKPRAADVLKAVADLAKWDGPGPRDGVARGVAVVESFNSYVAQIAEVSIGSDGEPRVNKVWCAVDCGVAVNPDVIRAQVEGGIGYATGHILYAEVPLVAGRPTVSNFNDYRSLRIMEMPEVEVVVLKSTEKPTGIGEPGVPPTGPAIANAIARLGRERPTRLPMVRQA